MTQRIKHLLLCTRFLMRGGIILSCVVTPLTLLSAPHDVTFDEQAFAATCFVAAAFIPLRLFVGLMESIPTPQPPTNFRLPVLAAVLGVVALMSPWFLIGSLVCLPIYWLAGIPWALRAALWGVPLFLVLLVSSAVGCVFVVARTTRPLATARRLGRTAMQRLGAFVSGASLHHRAA